MINVSQHSDTTGIDLVVPDDLFLGPVELTVRDAMSSDVVTVSPGVSSGSAVRAMCERHVSSLVVVDNANIVGIVTEKDIVAHVALGFGLAEATVDQMMSSPVAVTSPKVPITRAVRLLADKAIKRLPVVAEGELVGIVTQTDLIRAFASLEPLNQISKIMSKDVVTVDVGATVDEAIRLMSSHNISCVLAMHLNEAVGLLTQKDVLNRIAVPRRDPQATCVVDIMSSPVVSVPPNYSVFSAERKMHELHVHRLAVMEDRRLCGIVTKTDISRAVRDRLQTAQQEYQRSLACAQEAVCTLDLIGNVTYVNSALVELFGSEDPDEFLQRRFLPEQFWANPVDNTHLLKKLKKGEVVTEELALRTTDDHPMHVAFLSIPTRGTCGQVNGRQVVLRRIVRNLPV